MSTDQILRLAVRVVLLLTVALVVQGLAGLRLRAAAATALARGAVRPAFIGLVLGVDAAAQRARGGGHRRADCGAGRRPRGRRHPRVLWLRPGRAGRRDVTVVALPAAVVGGLLVRVRVEPWSTARS